MDDHDTFSSREVGASVTVKEKRGTAATVALGGVDARRALSLARVSRVSLCRGQTVLGSGTLQ